MPLFRESYMSQLTGETLAQVHTNQQLEQHDPFSPEIM
jgi:hypothetical protein